MKFYFFSTERLQPINNIESACFTIGEMLMILKDFNMIVRTDNTSGIIHIVKDVTSTIFSINNFCGTIDIQIMIRDHKWIQLSSRLATHGIFHLNIY